MIVEECVCLSGVFFFQAEDGIRDLVRSRGLGDVYKRQNRNNCLLSPTVPTRVHPWLYSKSVSLGGMNGGRTVSYTHLTLPTTDLG